MRWHVCTPTHVTYICCVYMYVHMQVAMSYTHRHKHTHTLSFSFPLSVSPSLSLCVCVSLSVSLSLILSLSVRLSHSVPWTQTNRKMHMVECVTMNRRIPKTLDRGSKLCHIATFCGLGILTISDGVFLEASRLSFMKPNG